MIKDTPSAVIVEPRLAPGRAPRGAVIWLHGLGADGHDFVPVVQELDLPGQGLRTILPHAPTMPVTINGGYVMPAWYDIFATDLEQRQDAPGIRRSGDLLNQWIGRQVEQGLTPGQVVVAGFSQGGAVALHAGLRYPQALAGILALSCYLPLAETLAAEHSAAALRTPVWMGHGLDDTVVPLTAAQASLAELRRQGFQATLQTYPMPHSVHPREIADIGAWLKEVLKLPG